MFYLDKHEEYSYFINVSNAHVYGVLNVMNVRVQLVSIELNSK